MQAIFKRNVMFVSPEGEKLVMKASPELQAAPDWIMNTDTFRLGLIPPKKGIQAIVLADGPSVASIERDRLLRENRQLQEQVQALQAQIASAPAKASAKK